MPLPAVLVAILDDNSKYVLSYFSPPLCFTINWNLWYYSTVLVLQLLIAGLVCVLGIVFRTLHKYQGILKSHPSLMPSQLRISSTEKRLLFTFCYYVVMGMVILVHSNIILRNWFLLLDSYEDYFGCQLKGVDPMLPHKCDELLVQAENYSVPELAIITSLTTGAAPVVNLLFVVNFNLIRKKISCFIRRAICVRTDTDHRVLDIVSADAE